MDFTLRQATLSDVDSISKLIDVSVRGFAQRIYSAEQIERSIGSVFGVVTFRTSLTAESDWPN